MVVSKNAEKATLKLQIPPNYEIEGTPLESLVPENKSEIKFSNFMLESIQRSNKQLTQIIDTNEHPILLAFGKKSRIYQFRINVLDGGEDVFGRSDDWLSDLELLYENATAKDIIDNDFRLYIRYSDRYFRGVWLDMSFQENSQRDKVVACSFNFYVMKRLKLPEVN